MRKSTDIIDMANQDEFTNQLLEAANSKLLWFNNEGLPKLLTEYRSYHSVITSLQSVLEKKGLLIPDPYRLDAHITKIEVPSNDHMNDGERAQQMGLRISQFERTLDYICNVLKFSYEKLDEKTIRSLLELNTFVTWTSLVETSPKENTRRMAEMLNNVKHGSDPLSNGVVTECIESITKSLQYITEILKDLTAFKKQMYKIEIRKNIFTNPQYTVRQDGGSMTEAVLQIKKLYSKCIPDSYFDSDLVNELVQEEYGPQGAQLRQKLLETFQIKEAKQEKKEAAVDTKAMLVTALHALCGLAPQFEQVLHKIVDNEETLVQACLTGWQKFMIALRKAFHIEEKPRAYSLTIVEQLTKSTRTETVNFKDFTAELARKARVFNALANAESPQSKKMFAQSEDAIFDFLIKQQSECQRMSTLITAFDDYFKNNAPAEIKSQIKGLKMELTSIKNILVKSNQLRAEYSAEVDEARQMARLGINNG